MQDEDRKMVENIPEFNALKEDLDTERKIFSITPELEHINDAILQVLYFGLKDTDNQYKVLVLGKQITKYYKNPLAILEAMYFATERILLGFEEHLNGDDNILYGNHDQNYFKEYQKRLHDQIHALRGGGMTSDTFSLYRDNYKKEMGKAAEGY